MDQSESPASKPRADRFDWLLVACALVLAFLAASFVTRKSEVWLHLAHGRLISEGRWTFDVDPLATQGTEAGSGFDVLVYGVFAAVGGVGLVVLKALLVTALAGLLLRIGSVRGRTWISVACTLVGIAAMSPALELQPGCLSLVLLGLTFWLLWLPGSGQGPQSHNTRRLAGMLVLMLLWVNVDAWFWIGPLLIALFWLGERWSGTNDSTPGWLVPASVVVCLVNPRHWHVFEPPMQLLRNGQLSWVWQQGGLPLREGNLAAWSQVVLVTFGLLSFALQRGNRVGWRLLVWLGFLALGLWQRAAIPYFAVVAAPIAALNFQDFFKARLPFPTRWNRVGRLATLVIAFALISLACPGWLQGFRDDTHRVGWGIAIDPSLRQAAETIREWRTEGLLRDGDRGLVLDREVAHYFRWFCPDENIILRDHRKYPLSAAAAVEALRSGGINYCVVADAASLRALPQPGGWSLLHVDGRATIFGWRKEAGCPRPVAVPALDANRLVFLDSGMPAVPAQGPRRDPEARDLWTRLEKPLHPAGVDSEAAGAYLRYFRAEELPQQKQLAQCRWAALSAGLTAMPAAATGMPVLAGLVRPHYLLGDLDGDLPAWPLVTIRLCRTALAADPDDVEAHVRLGQAYLALERLTGERSEGRALPLLVEMRHVQIVTALEQAITADPDQETAHQLLANLYVERGHLDAALVHRREELRLARRAGGRRFEQFSSLETQVKQLDQAVQNARKSWQLRTRTDSAADPVADAEAALRLGLARAALDEVLLPAPQELLGSKGLRLEFSLTLQLGHAEQLRRLLLAADAREHRQNLGNLEILSTAYGPGVPAGRLPAYDWLVLLLAVSCGDYDLAEQQIQEMLGQVELQHQRSFAVARRRLPLALASELGLPVERQFGFTWLFPRVDRHEGTQFLWLTHFLESELASLNVLGGMIALERGQPGRCEEYLSRALTQRTPGTALDPDFAGRALAERYRARIRAARPGRVP